MAELSRYNVNGKESNILANKLQITDSKILEDIETLLLADAYNYFLQIQENQKFKFNTKLILNIHKYFFNTLYSWAGKTRTVEISKNGVLFCGSIQIKKELEVLDKIIKENLPKKYDSIEIIAKKLALIHCEYNAIHPFREGNGRTIRLFLDLLSLNAGQHIIDYSKSTQKEYIDACIAGMTKNYSKMQKIFELGLLKNSN
jgi:cell filamentation protein